MKALSIMCFSNSATALSNIRRMANDLRTAAKGGKWKLKAVLHTYLCELRTKSFSPASEDKSKTMLTTWNSTDDSLIVGLIMTDLVDEVAEHWDKIAHAQRYRQSMARHVSSLIFGHDRQMFSEATIRSLRERMSHGEGKIELAYLTFLPVVVHLLFIVGHSGDPSRGLFSNLVFLLLMPVYCSPCLLYFMKAIVHVASSPQKPVEVHEGRIIPLVVVNSLCSCGLLLLQNLIFGTYLVPFTPVWFGSTAAWITVPLLVVFGIKRESLRSTWKNVLMSILFVLVITCVGAGCYPCLWWIWYRVGEWGQAFVAMAFVMLRIATDHLQNAIVSRTSCDKMPCILLLSMSFYAAPMVLLAGLGNINVGVFCVLVGADILENVIAFMILVRDRKRGIDNRVFMHRMAMICIREIVEVVSPLHGISLMTLAGNISPQSFFIFDSMGTNSFRSGLMYLIMDWVMESLVFIAFCVAAHEAFNISMFRLTMALLAELGPVLVASNVGCEWSYFLFFLSPHMGVDWTFEFPWLENHNATWLHGHCWEGHDLDRCTGT
eukprot:TRINITY_DN25588_c0_g1_i1.p1 TRINITY_DN25588_c0_g1~~TRINITY_DN25588_c0_g1_i1.p1  ORF type:complete len:548 (+),score=42.74 TRINITY_DN25588_c0_g1_i1:796-2439(+)